MRPSSAVGGKRLLADDEPAALAAQPAAQLVQEAGEDQGGQHTGADGDRQPGLHLYGASEPTARGSLEQRLRG